MGLACRANAISNRPEFFLTITTSLKRCADEVIDSPAGGKEPRYTRGARPFHQETARTVHHESNGRIDSFLRAAVRQHGDNRGRCIETVSVCRSETEYGAIGGDHL